MSGLGVGLEELPVSINCLLFVHVTSLTTTQREQESIPVNLFFSSSRVGHLWRRKQSPGVSFDRAEPKQLKRDTNHEQLSSIVATVNFETMPISVAADTNFRALSFRTTK